MLDTPMRLCEADAASSGELSRVLCSVYDGFPATTPVPQDNGAVNATEQMEESILLAGQSGFRLWELTRNVGRCFLLFTVRASHTLHNHQELSVSVTPEPVTAAITHTAFAHVERGGRAQTRRLVVFTLTHRSDVFVTPLPSPDDNQLDDDGTDSVAFGAVPRWFLEGSRVRCLESAKPSSHSSTPVRGQVTSLTTCPLANSNDTFDSRLSACVLVARGTENGHVAVWSIARDGHGRFISELEQVFPHHEQQHNRDDVGIGACPVSQSAVTALCFAGPITLIVGGRQPNVRVLRVPPGLRGELTPVTSLDPLHTGWPSVTSLACLHASPSHLLLAVGAQEGALFVWAMEGPEDDASADAWLDGALVEHTTAAITCVAFAMAEDGVPLVVVGAEDCTVGLFERVMDDRDGGAGRPHSANATSPVGYWVLLSETRLRSPPVGVAFINSCVAVTCESGVEHWDPSGASAVNFARNFTVNDSVALHAQQKSQLQTSSSQQDNDAAFAEELSHAQLHHEEYASGNNNNNKTSALTQDSYHGRELQAGHAIDGGDNDMEDIEQDTEFEQPTPAPASRAPRPLPHPLHEFGYVEVQPSEPCALAHGHEPTPPPPPPPSSFPPHSPPSPSRPRGLPHRHQRSLAAEQERYPVSMASDLDCYPVSMESDLESINAQENVNNTDNAPTCFDGFRNRDVTPLPLSVLQEPAINSTREIHRKLQQLRSTTYGSNKVTRQSHAKARGKEKSSLDFPDDASGDENDDGNSNVELVSLNPRSPRLRARRVPPQVSKGWSYVPLLERLPELSRKYAVRQGRVTDADDEEPSERELARHGGTRKHQQRRHQEREQQEQQQQLREGHEQHEHRTSMENQRQNFYHGQMPSQEQQQQQQHHLNHAHGQDRGHDDVHHQDNESTSSKSNSNTSVPWFYRQQRRNDIWSREEFYLTRADDGTLQFHNFRSLPSTSMRR